MKIFKDSFVYTLFFFGISIHIILITILPISLSADSFQYLKISNNPFVIGSLENRTMGYPLFIFILRLFELFKIEFGIILVIFVQSLMMIFLPILIYLSFKIYDIIVSKIISIFYLIYLYPHWMSNQIMTESLFLFLLSLSIFFANKYFFTKKLFYLSFTLFLIFILILVRPTSQLFIFIFPFIFIFYFFKQRNKISIIHFCIVLIFSTFLFIFNNLISTNASKSFALFNFWHSSAAQLCKINDNVKISLLNKNNTFVVPDEQNYLMVEKKFDELNSKDLGYAYMEKCIKYGNGPMTNRYFNVVASALENNPSFYKTLTSKYDDRGSPSEIDKDLIDLTPIEIVKRVHEKYRFPLPFMHIVWNLNSINGFQNTSYLLMGVLFETYTKHNYLLIDRIRERVKDANIFDFQSMFENGKAQGKMDMNYWRFIPSPYLSLESQGLQHWYNFPPKVYLQNISSLEKLIGNHTKFIYQDSKIWNGIEKDFEENNNISFFINNFLINKNVSNFSIEILYNFNLLSYLLIKLLILVFLPIYFLIKGTYFLITIITKKNTNFESLFYSSALFSLIGYAAIIISIFLFYDERHIMMHLILFTPLILSLILDIKKFFIS